MSRRFCFDVCGGGYLQFRFFVLWIEVRFFVDKGLVEGCCCAGSFLFVGLEIVLRGKDRLSLAGRMFEEG